MNDRRVLVITAFVAVAIGFGARAGKAEEGPSGRGFDGGSEEFYQRVALDWHGLRDQQFLATVMSAGENLPRRKKRRTLDLTPLAEYAIHYVQGLGIPLIEHRDENGRRPVAVSASFSTGKDSPAVKLHLGDRPGEPLGAFYPPEKGFRFSVVYPVKEFTLRLEAGDDSEFGSLAVAGISWVHPNQRIAAGFGLPIKLDNSESDFGAIFQFRLKLD